MFPSNPEDGGSGRYLSTRHHFPQHRTHRQTTWKSHALLRSPHSHHVPRMPISRYASIKFPQLSVRRHEYACKGTHLQDVLSSLQVLAQHCLLDCSPFQAGVFQLGALCKVNGSNYIYQFSVKVPLKLKIQLRVTSLALILTNTVPWPLCICSVGFPNKQAAINSLSVYGRRSSRYAIFWV